jgi:hypothetical protein
MANRERGQLGVDVNGKRYTLEPGFDAVCELEDLIGKRVDSEDGPMSAIQQGRRSGLRAVVWCLLHEHHADEFKTLKDASRWIEDAGQDNVLAWVEQVFALNEPDKAQTTGGVGNPPDAQAGIGTNSSPQLVESA